MENKNYEIEIKCLLGNEENAKELEQKMFEYDSNIKKIGSHKQLNHYFYGNGDWNKIAEAITDDDAKTFLEITNNAKEVSLRTRETDLNTLLVLKASIDDTTSANGTARREFEKKMNTTLEELDNIILSAGFLYQAKWSRERTEFVLNNKINVMIDKNAGYGYLVEFEIIETDPEQAENRKNELRNLITKLGLQELNQDRLARMFDYYNKNWRDYYGTEKIFVIE